MLRQERRKPEWTVQFWQVGDEVVVVVVVRVSLESGT